MAKSKRESTSVRVTAEEYQKHLDSVAGGPRNDGQIAAAERRYRARIDASRAELLAAEYQARRAPGAPPLSPMMAALQASAPSFKSDIATLPEVEETPATPVEQNGGGQPLDREMLKALGSLWVETKHKRGRAEAWDELTENVMRNLYRLVPGFGTLKDVVGMVKALEEYSNPVATDTKKIDKTSLYRKALLQEE